MTMGKMCERHEQFVQDGATCPYCETAPSGIDPHTYENAPAKSSGHDERSCRTDGTFILKDLPKEYTAGGYYSGFDIIPLHGTPAYTPFDAAGWVTPAIKQQNGLLLPATPIKIDTSLRADLAAEMDRQDLRRDLLAKFEEFIDAVLAKLREKT